VSRTMTIPPISTTGSVRRPIWNCRLLVLCLATFVALPLAAAECIPKTNAGKSESFSSVTKVTVPNASARSSHLLSGIELVLDESSDSALGTLLDYEGSSAPLVAKLKGSISESAIGCKVQLSGSNKRGIVEIEGIISVASFQGTITRRVRREVYLEKVSLRRKPTETESHVGSIPRQGQFMFGF
jgi:hypothetical protein